MPIQPYPYWDLNTIIYLQNHLASWVPFLKLVSIIISPPIMFMIGFLIFFMDKKRGIFCLVYLALVTFFALALKDIIHHPRPYWVSPYVTGYISPLDFGMPSGHAMFGFFLIFVASLYRKTYGYALAFIGLFLVCLSRMVLGAHFVEQVLAGLLLGIFSGILAIYVPKIIWGSPFNFKGKILFLSILSLLFFILFTYLYLEFGLYFEARPEWSALVSGYTDKTIHQVNFLGVGASFLFSLSLLLSLVLEKEYINFTPRILHFKNILMGIIVVCSYLLTLVLILIVCLFISKSLAVLVGSFLVPYIFCYRLLLEASYLGVLESPKIQKGKISKMSLSYWFKNFYVQ